MKATTPLTLVRGKFKGSRNDAYRWLSNTAGIPKEVCHFGMMDEETAERVFKLCLDEVLS